MKKAKAFQIKGADTQKAAVAKRVKDGLERLGEAIKSGRMSVRRSARAVYEFIGVAGKTLDRPYHADSRAAVDAFMRVNGFAKSDGKPAKNLPKKRSMREQLVALAQDAEITRLRMQCEIDDLMDRLKPDRRRARVPSRDNFRSILMVNGPDNGAQAGAGRGARNS
jgi:hypothetical protein